MKKKWELYLSLRTNQYDRALALVEDLDSEQIKDALIGHLIVGKKNNEAKAMEQRRLVIKPEKLIRETKEIVQSNPEDLDLPFTEKVEEIIPSALIEEDAKLKTGRYSFEEIAFIRDNKDKMSVDEMAEELNRSPYSVKNKMIFSKEDKPRSNLKIKNKKELNERKILTLISKISKREEKLDAFRIALEKNYEIGADKNVYNIDGMNCRYTHTKSSQPVFITDSGIRITPLSVINTG